ncbi:MAG: AraC family transcriptional regulator [Alphaproteobacteria bacterium]
MSILKFCSFNLGEFVFEGVCGENISHQFPSHIHNHTVIGMVENGEMTIASKTKNIKVLAGDVFIINKNFPHKCMFNQCYYKVVPLFSSKEKSFVLDVKQDLTIYNLLKEMFASPDRVKDSYYKIIERVENIFINQDGSKDIIKLDKIDEIKSYIIDNCSQSLSLDMLSKTARKSKFCLNREFSQKIGIPPHYYQNYVRIMEAKKMLQNGSGILDAAVKFGFFDQAHFSKFFKRFIGISPKKFIKSNQIKP